MRFFEVKVKVDRMMSSGAMKNVSEIYAVDAMTFTEAEARTTECVHTETEGVFEVISEKRAKYDEVVFNDGEMFFLVKFILITYNDGGNERRNPKFVLFRAESIDKAKEILVTLENQDIKLQRQEYQQTAQEDKIRTIVKQIDFNNITPMKATETIEYLISLTKE